MQQRLLSKVCNILCSRRGRSQSCLSSVSYIVLAEPATPLKNLITWLLKDSLSNKELAAMQCSCDYHNGLINLMRLRTNLVNKLFFETSLVSAHVRSIT